MNGFWIRVVNLTAVVAIIACYALVMNEREEADVRMQAAMEEEYERWKEQNAELLAAASADAQEDTGVFVDGTYSGTAQGYGGPITVEVTVEGGQIAAVNVVSHDQEDELYFQMAAGLIPSILEQQSPEVDIVSGATLSSNGIRTAVAYALEGAYR